MYESLFPGKRALLLGIGGSGMSAIAHILLDMNFEVFGYDKKISNVTNFLKERGAFVYQSLESIDSSKISFIVISSAINDKNHSIFQEVSNLRIPMFHRSEVLHKIFSLHKSISVAGSHGKTSTTTMIAQILEESNFEPSVMIGADTALLGKKGGKFGKGEWGVYESDESDGTFQNHLANIRVVSNIDNDHLDFYKTKDRLETAFLKYISPNQPGSAVLQGNDNGVQNILSNLSDKTEISKEFQLYVMWRNIDFKEKWIVDLHDRLKSLMKDQYAPIFFDIHQSILSFNYLGHSYQLKLPYEGEHYLTNGLTAVISGFLVSIPLEKGIETLSNYIGVKRRQEVLGNRDGVTVVDDYGHHPTEINIVIKSLKANLSANKKIVVLFQPHRYTRTQLLQVELADALSSADFLYLLPIYSAGEKEIEGVTSASIAKHLNGVAFKLLSGEMKADVMELRKQLNSGDLLLSLGAGSVREWGEDFLR
jgi:UDP-N-acetylmuramate--alanine ligase